MSRWIRPLGATTLTVALAAGGLVPLAVAAGPAAAAADEVTGVDVSSWQHPNNKPGDIVWPSVAAAGHDFAIVKATESTTYKNPYYASDIKGARDAGMVVGAYHFARPKLPLTTAKDQARYFVNAIGTTRTARTLPPVLDIEDTGGLSKADTIAWTKSFLTTVRSLTGRTPMVYSYDNFLRTSLGNSTEFKDYPLWYAKYSTTPPGALPGGWKTWTIWQHTSQGTVPGMKGDIDLNRFNGTKADLLRLADGTRAAPLTPGSPTGLEATLAWPDVKLAWSSPASSGGSTITHYVVTVDGVTAGTTPTRSFVAGPLEPGAHTFAVRAVSAAGTGPSATTTLTVPSPTPGQVAAARGTSTLTLVTPAYGTREYKSPVTVTLRRTDTRQVLPGKAVRVTLLPAKGGRKTFDLVTNANGVASTQVTHRVNAKIAVNYDGDTRLARSSASVAVKVRPRPTIALSKTSVKRGTKVTLSGNVTSYYKGETVKQQRYQSGAWRTVASTKVLSNGKYRFTVTTPKKGTYKYRVLSEPTKLHMTGVSTGRTLKVK